MSAATTSGALAAGGASNDTFVFPPKYNFPPMWTLQRTLSTRAEQMRWWSAFIQSWCAQAGPGRRVWRLTLVDALDTPLFHNAKLHKRMTLDEARALVDWMSREEGGRRAEWIGAGAASNKDSSKADAERAAAWIYWRRPEEWAETIAQWVEDTGQKNTVLTLYEIGRGDAARSQEFYGMDPELLQKALQVLVKRGRAQIFGAEDQQGVKIF